MTPRIRVLEKHFDAIRQYLFFFPFVVNGKEIVLVDKKIAGGISEAAEKIIQKGYFFAILSQRNSSLRRIILTNPISLFTNF